MKAILEKFKDARKRDFYLRWLVRVLILVGVVYLTLFKDTSRETIFVQPDAARDTVVIIDYQLIEVNKRDSVIKYKYHETIKSNDTLADDSLRQSILRAVRLR